MKLFLKKIWHGISILLRCIFCIIRLTSPIIIGSMVYYFLTKAIPTLLALLCGVLIIIFGYCLLYVRAIAFEAAQYYKADDTNTLNYQKTNTD